MLAVGFCVFWELGRSVLLRGIAIFLIGATLVNTVIFVRAPNSFLENRQTGATYQYLFDMLGHVDFALMLPVETDDDVNVDAARNLAIGGAAIVLLLAVALARRQPLYAAPVVLLLLVALDLSRVRVLPARDYVLQYTENGFKVTFQEPVPTTYVQFGSYWQTWSGRFPLVIADASGREVQELVAANQVVAASCSTGVQSVSVSGSPSFDFRSQLTTRLVVSITILSQRHIAVPSLPLLTQCRMCSGRGRRNRANRSDARSARFCYEIERPLHVTQIEAAQSAQVIPVGKLPDRLKIAVGPGVTKIPARWNEAHNAVRCGQMNHFGDDHRGDIVGEALIHA